MKGLVKTLVISTFEEPPRDRAATFGPWALAVAIKEAESQVSRRDQALAQMCLEAAKTGAVGGGILALIFSLNAAGGDPKTLAVYLIGTGIEEWPKARKRCSSPTTRPPFSNSAATASSPAKSNALGREQGHPQGRRACDLRRPRPPVHRQAASAGRDDRAGRAGEGGGSGRRNSHCSCNVVTGALRRNRCAQPPLRCHRCAATAYFPRATHWSLTNSATAFSWRFRLLEAASA